MYTRSKVMTKPHETRRQKALPLIGALIIFATFVTKEGIGDNVKDLASKIDTAKNVFAIRQQVVLARMQSPSPPNPIIDVDQAVTFWDEQSVALMSMSRDLADSFGRLAQFNVRAAPIEREAKQTADDFKRIVPNVPLSIQAVLDNLSPIGRRAWLNSIAATDISRDILNEAQQAQRKREHEYEIAKVASYALFALGWGLAFYGKLFADETETEEAL